MSYLNTFTSPRFKTSFLLPQAGGTYTVSPNNPATNRTLTIIDPGANDSFLFVTATQNLGNKTLTTNLAAGGFKVTGAADPSASSDYATKNYVDSVAQGLSPKPSAVATTTAALSPSNTYANGASGVGATLTAGSNGVLTVDGINIVLNNYVLVKNEAAPANNGLYKCTTAGTVSVPYVLTRAVEMDSAAKYVGAYILTDAGGTTNADVGFICTNSAAPTVGTTSITFAQFTGAGSLVAGNGINIATNTISVVSDATQRSSANTIAVAATGISISSTYVGQSSIVTLGTITTGVWTGTSIADANIATSYIKADGSRALTSNWAAGAFSITANSVVMGQAANQLNNSDDSGVNSTNMTAFTVRGGNKTGAAGTTGAGAQLSLIGGSATGASSTGGGGNLLLAGGTSVGGAAGVVNIADATDNSKLVGFSINGSTTATKTTLVFSQTTARTITFPNATTTLVGTNTTDTLSSKTLISPIIQYPTVAKSANYSLSATTDDTVNFTTGSSALNATLPLAATAAAGKAYTIRKVDSGSGTVTLVASGSDTFGLNSVVIDEQYDSITVESDGTSIWYGQ